MNPDEKHVVEMLNLDCKVLLHLIRIGDKNPHNVEYLEAIKKVLEYYGEPLMYEQEENGMNTY